MANAPQAIFVLFSIHHVLRGEKALKKAGLEFDLIPVPKEINPDCGMAIETAEEKADQARQALLQAGLKIEAVYRREGKNFSLIN
ncbi:MAG: DUF3343 domain-containing protein [Pseudomonadota bacterium]